MAVGLDPTATAFVYLQTDNPQDATYAYPIGTPRE